MKVSVILGTFGHQSWQKLAVERAAPSARAQKPWEVLSCHMENGTLAQARNHAAAEATGDWLCVLDADDELCDGYLDAMERAWADSALEDSQPLLVPAVCWVDNAEPPTIPSWGRPIEDVNCAVIGSLVSKALFDRVGGFHEWPIYEDWDLWLRCVEQGASLVPVPEAVYCAHSREGRNSYHADPETALRTYKQIRAEHERRTR